MPMIKPPEGTRSQNPSNAAKQKEEDEKLDRIADEAAEEADRTEKRYDSEHSIFTK